MNRILLLLLLNTPLVSCVNCYSNISNSEESMNGESCLMMFNLTIACNYTENINLSGEKSPGKDGCTDAEDRITCTCRGELCNTSDNMMQLLVIESNKALNKTNWNCSLKILDDYVKRYANISQGSTSNTSSTGLSTTTTSKETTAMPTTPSTVPPSTSTTTVPPTKRRLEAVKPSSSKAPTTTTRTTQTTIPVKSVKQRSMAPVEQVTEESQAYQEMDEQLNHSSSSDERSKNNNKSTWLHALLAVFFVLMFISIIICCLKGKKKRAARSVANSPVSTPTIRMTSNNPHSGRNWPQEPNFENLSEGKFENQSVLRIPTNVNKSLAQSAKSTKESDQPINQPLEFDPALNEIFIIGTNVEHMDSQSDMSVSKTNGKSTLNHRKLSTAKLPTNKPFRSPERTQPSDVKSILKTLAAEPPQKEKTQKTSKKRIKSGMQKTRTEKTEKTQK